MENKIQIKYDPDFSDDGVKVVRRWHAARVYFEKLCGIRSEEKLTGLTIDEHGITAHIGSKD